MKLVIGVLMLSIGCLGQVFQAPGVVEVTNSGQTFNVTFQSVKSLVPGMIVSTQIIMPGGLVIPLNTYQITTPRLFGVSMWNGPFPEAWPAGWTTFRVVISQAGSITELVAASVPVRACCRPTGPVDRVDLSADGETLVVIGMFPPGDVRATLNGINVDLFFQVFGRGTIPTKGFEGQSVLTVCAGGYCSSRVVYISRPGQR